MRTDCEGSRRLECLILLLATCVCMAPVWLVSRDLWDGVAAAYAIETNQFDGLKLWLMSSNWWLLYAMYQGVAWLAAQTGVEWWVFVKALIHCSALGVAWETTQLARNALDLRGRSPLMAGLMVCALPVWPMMYDSVHMVFVFVWMALLGHRLWATSTRKHEQMLGLLLIAVSLQLNSNVLFVLALEAVRWVKRRSTGRRVDAAQSLLLLVVIVAYALLSRWLAPPVGPNTGYNALLKPWHWGELKRMLGAVIMFATWFIFPLAVAALGAVVCWMAKLRPGAVQTNVWVKLAVVSSGAVGAYVAVGKGPALFFPVGLSADYVFSQLALSPDSAWVSTADHWIGRHAFLWIVPVALLCATLMRSIASASRTGAAVVGVLALAHAFAWQLHGHSAKINRVLAEESIVSALKTLPPPPAGDVNLRISPRLGVLFSTLESNYMVYRAWGADQYMATTAYQTGATTALTQEGRREVKKLVSLYPPMGQANVAGAWSINNSSQRACTTAIDVVISAPINLISVLQLVLSHPVTTATAQVASTECAQATER